jgi:predicted O-linked N-acetylglucosamine transferase (SPINDLY family)
LILFLLLIFIIQLIRSNSKQNISDINVDIIKIGYYCNRLKYGGVERVMALLINYLSKEKIFVHYLISESGILKDEYSIPNSTRRINLNYPRRSVFDAIEENQIDIFIDYFENDLKQDNL